jgi:hypothetical protein
MLKTQCLPYIRQNVQRLPQLTDGHTMNSFVSRFENKPLFPPRDAGLQMAVEEESMKKAILFWLSLALLVVPALTAQGQAGPEPPREYSAQQKESPSAGAILGDFIFIRPFALIAVAVGVVGTVASLPFSVPSGSVGTVARKLIAEPFNFTFTRPLGTFPADGVPWS